MAEKFAARTLLCVFCPVVAGSENGDDFEVDEIAPAADPNVQEFARIGFHDLIAGRAVGFHPAGDIHDALGHHAAFGLEAFADEFGVTGAKFFDDHK